MGTANKGGRLFAGAQGREFPLPSASEPCSPFFLLESGGSADSPLECLSAPGWAVRGSGLPGQKCHSPERWPNARRRDLGQKNSTREYRVSPRIGRCRVGKYLGAALTWSRFYPRDPALELLLLCNSTVLECGGAAPALESHQHCPEQVFSQSFSHNSFPTLLSRVYLDWPDTSAALLNLHHLRARSEQPRGC